MRAVRTAKPSADHLEFPQDADFHMGGGGLFLHRSGHLTFTRMLVGGTLDGVQVLKPETVKLAWRRNAIGDIEVPKLRSNNPAMALEVEMFPGQVKKWGLSFIINTQDVQERPRGREPGVGGSPQHLLLDRHQPADHRRRHDANSAGRRPACARDHGEASSRRFTPHDHAPSARSLPAVRLAHGIGVPAGVRIKPAPQGI